eukprot:TRINITY_DN774167_c0_g1_i1.p1 TRINITY_DN774167_c0_g1~~TRINITY_DN774167_c0_g1_i1.p1  ORF type:complete len:126 (+),score=21.93 TRINITY_DN774167_c0_g1_i1:44-421(+)
MHRQINLPDRDELIRLPEDSKRVLIHPSTKFSNCSSYIVVREDHTVGNLLRMKLLENKHVEFAGYQIPHPTVDDVTIRVRTDGVITPSQAMKDATQTLNTEFRELSQRISAEIDRVEKAEAPDFH